MWIVSLIGIALGIWLAVLMHRKEKRKEDRYFERMEKAFRNANDRNDHNDKTD